MDGFLCPNDTAWRLTSDVVHIWRVALDEAATRVDTYTEVLSAAECRRAEAYRFERDGKAFRAGRGVLRTLIGRYLGLAPASLQFTYGERGKPAISTNMGRALHFNVSHSHQLLLCAVTANRDVGVDVERITPLPDLDDVAGCVFSSSERDVLSAAPVAEKVRTFFRCWTRKEAYIKADGHGFALPVCEIEVSLRPGEPARLLKSGRTGVDPGRWSLRDLTPGADYAGAVAVEGEDWQMQCWEWA